MTAKANTMRLWGFSEGDMAEELERHEAVVRKLVEVCWKCGGGPDIGEQLEEEPETGRLFCRGCRMDAEAFSSLTSDDVCDS